MPSVGDVQDVAESPYRLFLHVFTEIHVAEPSPGSDVAGVHLNRQFKGAAASRLWLSAASEPNMVAQLEASHQALSRSRPSPISLILAILRSISSSISTNASELSPLAR